MSQEEPPAISPQFHTGISQDMASLHLPNGDDKATQTDELLEVKTEEVAPVGSQAFCVVVSRPSAGGDPKILRHLIPNTFFVLPDNATDEDKRKVRHLIGCAAGQYDVNQYSVERLEFEVPFEVDVISKVTTGYVKPKPKALAVADVTVADVSVNDKKKRKADDDEPRSKRRNMRN